jgi:hypothetical protein
VSMRKGFMLKKLLCKSRSLLGVKESRYSNYSSLFDYSRLRKIAEQQSLNYSGADPYPHILLEDILAKDTLRDLCKVFPRPDAKVYRREFDVKTAGDKVQYNKLGSPPEEALNPLFRQLLWEMNSGMFIRFLEQLTGVKGLLADPSLRGAGLHQSLPGAVLGVHADFTNHRIYKLDRRLNVLLYLNEDWRDEYGGHLELWSRDMSQCVRRIRPSLGRCVIFSTDATSFHGHPDQLSCPDGITRKSVALYYYSNGREDSLTAATKATIWKETSRKNLPVLE